MAPGGLQRDLRRLPRLQRTTDRTTALVIQAQYGDDAQAIADYVAEPVRRQPDFPNMPPQGHISEEMRLLVAEYMLGLDG